MGGSEKFSRGMVRSQKPLLWSPFIVNNYCSYSEPTYTIQHGYTAFNSIPRPPIKSINDLTSTDKQRKQTNKRISKYMAPPNPQGDRPRSIQSLAINY